jgi:hypothetical protein
MRYHALCAAALVLAIFTSALNAQQKQAIERADQLPAHNYAVTNTPSALLHDEAGFAEIMRTLRVDLESDLARYDIRDAATVRSYYRALGRIAFFEHRFDDALAYESRAGALEDKPAARLLSSVMFPPLLAAEKAGAGGAAQAFSTTLAEELARLRYESVRADLRRLRDGFQKQSAALLERMAANTVDPAVHNGRISKDLAMQLLDFKFGLRRVPYYDEIVRQLSALDAAHPAETTPDSPGARDVSLDGRPGLTPIVVAIWDVGVDTAVFPDRVWTNAREVPGNGKDDDGNGYVDDVHGIAWSWDGAPLVGDMPPLEASPADVAKANPRFYALGYAHGTRVAGIAVRDNPAARVLVVRGPDVPTRSGPAPAPATATWAAAFTRALVRSIEYYRNAGVRVVNMSWYEAPSVLEETLEMNRVGATQQERHQLAMQSFEIVKSGFRAALAAAPDILFVCGAGNSNSNNRFNDFVPASFDLPNLITVGAVDQAGNETGFTSFGKVDLYANGAEVETVEPGGARVRASGTSMSSPQVVNLAAKLLAVYPNLTVAALRKLIIDGADARELPGGRSIRLLNQARSFELAATAR